MVEPGESVRRKMLALLALELDAANLEQIASTAVAVEQETAVLQPSVDSSPLPAEAEAAAEKKGGVTFGRKSNMFPIHEDRIDSDEQSLGGGGKRQSTERKEAVVDGEVVAGPSSSATNLTSAFSPSGTSLEMKGPLKVRAN
jgi:hypothetical protein